MNGDAGPGTSGAPQLDPAIHHPTRLAVVSFLSACDEAEFAAVRDCCQVSDSVLSKAASALEAAGYVDIHKGYVGKRPRTWLALTDAGELALTRHLAALQGIAAAARRAGARTRAGAAEGDRAAADRPE
jgi:DNA-binding MarR family transcriptional regulator